MIYNLFSFNNFYLLQQSKKGLKILTRLRSTNSTENEAEPIYSFPVSLVVSVVPKFRMHISKYSMEIFQQIFTIINQFSVNYSQISINIPNTQ